MPRTLTAPNAPRAAVSTDIGRSGAQVLSIHAKQLIALGRAVQIVDAGTAAGRCLATALDLAARARERRIAVELVTWRVVGDPDFADHWAVRLDATRVIDPTRVQVDGSRRLVCTVDDYPSNYRRRRCYPAAVLLPALGRVECLPASGRVATRHLVGLQLRRLAHDLARGAEGGSVAYMLSACLDFGRFAMATVTGTARRALQARAVALEQRLAQIGDPSAAPSARTRGA